MDNDLSKLIERKAKLDPIQIKNIMKQLLEGIEYLHSNNIMHRDIKTANILINRKGDIKLADFGLARKLISNKAYNYTNRVVTYWYRCPELLLGTNKYTQAIDIWSIGCCFYEILSFRPLFPSEVKPKLMELIYEKCGSPDENTWPGVSLLKNYADLKPKKKYSRKIAEEFKVYEKYILQSILR